MHAKNSNRMLLGMQRPVLVIVVDTSKMPGIPRHEFQVDAPEQWITTIQSGMASQSAEATDHPHPTVVKEVVREIVKYPCPYCNTLMEVTLNRCPSCGAPQKK
jgi:hypothetical protein